MHRSPAGEIREIITDHEALSFRENPFDFFLILARYKFAARLLKKTQHVLDVGCALGSGSLMLRNFAGKVTGADFDSEVIERNRKTFKDLDRLDFMQLDLLKVSGKHPTFDAVVSMDVIEHFKEEQIPAVAKAYADLTKDGGFAVIGTPNLLSQPYASKRRLETHLCEMDPDQFTKFLEPHFRQVFLFSMTDEVVSTSFNKMAWYLMALCTK